MIKQKDGFYGERAMVLPLSVVESMEKDSLTAPLHITDIGYYPRAKYHYRERKEPISQYVLIYCIEGEGWFSINGERHSVSANQYFILPAYTPHAYGSLPERPWTIYWIHFKGNQAHAYAEGARTPQTIQPGLRSRINNRMDLFEEIYHTLEMGYSRENLRYMCACFTHYLASLRHLHAYRNAVPSDIQAYDPVTASIHYMKESIEKKITLDDLARQSGYSVSHFSAIFTEQTGLPPIKYLNQLKIQEACRLLDCTNMKINQICFKVGIEDNLYFSRLFHKIMGVTPSEYKQMKKG